VAKESGFNFSVSNAGFNELDRQKDEAIEFLKQNEAEIRRLEPARNPRILPEMTRASRRNPRALHRKSNEFRGKSNEFHSNSNELRPKSNELRPKSNELDWNSNEFHQNPCEWRRNSFEWRENSNEFDQDQRELRQNSFDWRWEPFDFRHDSRASRRPARQRLLAAPPPTALSCRPRRTAPLRGRSAPPTRVCSRVNSASGKRDVIMGKLAAQLPPPAALAHHGPRAARNAMRRTGPYIKRLCPLARRQEIRWSLQ
jgi:hypothetical protein